MEDEFSQRAGRQRRATANRNYTEDSGSDNETEPKKRKTSGGKKQMKRNTNDSDDENTPPESGPSQKRSRSGAQSQSQEPDSMLDDELEYEEEEIPAEELEDLETGQIMRVFVQDFMCHHKLTVEFGRNVNFVTGNNGSGKSAIVAALQICFGARASSTGRDKKISNMIREGSDGPAILRVTLRNEGTDAFKFDSYGERIIVERKITKSGAGGGYKLMNKHGNVRSIYDYFSCFLYSSRVYMQVK
jgi:structural maintenance of chromosomes protein 6